MDDAEYDAHLFAHQRAAVARMVDMETRDECVLNESESIEARVAFYTDPPGAGKTRGIIGLVLRTAHEPRLPRPNIKCSYTVQNLVRVAHTGGVPRARLTRTTLIVVTASLVAQWERELERSKTIKASLVVVRRVAERRHGRRVGATNRAAPEHARRVRRPVGRHDALLEHVEAEGAQTRLLLLVRAVLVLRAEREHVRLLTRLTLVTLVTLVSLVYQRRAIAERGDGHDHRRRVDDGDVARRTALGEATGRDFGIYALEEEQ